MTMIVEIEAGGIDSFVLSLKNKPPFRDIFNPWWENDSENDIGIESVEVRRNQLRQYLSARQDSAKYLLLGEALGYQGGHFSGIAMMSERLLLGHLKSKGLSAGMVFKDLEPLRTSKKEIRNNGFTEPTATIVWGAIADLKLDPFSILIWNAFPWHPFKDGVMLSNRTPDEEEMKYGISVLMKLLSLFDFESIIAVGKKAEKLLIENDIGHQAVRHPANGGAGLFRQQFANIVKEK